jgi:hypothetical protein
MHFKHTLCTTHRLGLKKGYFPHLFNRKENQSVVLNHLPDVHYYHPDAMKLKDRKALMESIILTRHPGTSIYMFLAPLAIIVGFTPFWYRYSSMGIFFDFECTQDDRIQCQQGYQSDDNEKCIHCKSPRCGAFEHKPNLCVVIRVLRYTCSWHHWL